MRVVTRRAPRRAGVGAVLLKRLPGESPMHRVGAVTKLISLALLTIATLLNPSWVQVLALSAVVGLAVVAARVPPSAVPRLPIWFWLIMLIGLALAALGHGAGQYLRLFCLSALFTVLSAVVAWTTELNDVAPALNTIGAPLRRIGLPVAEWAITTALCVRSLPLLLDECRTMIAARRLRTPPQRLQPLVLARSTVDLLAAAMAVTIRRAADMGEAIAIRGGGTGPIRRSGRLGWPDAIGLVAVAVACVLPTALGR